MKKLFCIFTILFACFAGLSAKENSESDANYLKTPLRLEVSYVPAFSADVKVAWSFPINNIFSFDAGINVNCREANMGLIILGLIFDGEKSLEYYQRTFNFLADTSFWFYDLYLTYGTGFCCTTAGTFLYVPFDVRLGWEPGARKNKACVPKFEFGYFANTFSFYDDTYDEKGNVIKKWESILLWNLILSIGVSIRF